MPALLVLLASCTGDPGDGPGGAPGRSEAASPPLLPAWREVTPDADGRAGWRPTFRDAVRCGGRWYVVGGLLGPGRRSQPAAWVSRNATRWTPVPIRAEEFYARRAVLSSVGCRGRRVAMVGDRSGGAHGLPRVTTYRQRADGRVVAVRAPFELYGGPSAVSVNRIAGGVAGWMISGSRTSGAAVWVSPDARRFRLVAGASHLASDRRRSTTAFDQVAERHRWTLVGAANVTGGGQVPMAWASRDGRHWTRQQVPVGEAPATLERVVDSGRSLVAVGLRGEGFGSWRRSSDGRWHAGPSFAPLVADGHAAPFVSGLAVVDHATLATVSDGSRFGLWALADGGWQPVATPVQPAATGDHTMTVAGGRHTLLLLLDDGDRARVLITRWPGRAR